MKSQEVPETWSGDSKNEHQARDEQNARYGEEQTDSVKNEEAKVVIVFRDGGKRQAGTMARENCFSPMSSGSKLASELRKNSRLPTGMGATALTPKDSGFRPAAWTQPQRPMEINESSSRRRPLPTSRRARLWPRAKVPER